MSGFGETQTGTLILPDGTVLGPKVETDDRGVLRVPGFLTRSEQEQLEAVLTAQFFLFPNGTGDYGERMICRARNPDGSVRGCGQKHMHITSNCIELPFKGGTGLEAGLFAVFRATRDGAKRQQIQAALDHIPEFFARMPDVATGHPFSARDWRPDQPGDNWLAALISLPEVISVEKARRFAVRINESHPPIRLCLREACSNYLEAEVWCSGKGHSYQ